MAESTAHLTHRLHVENECGCSTDVWLDPNAIDRVILTYCPMHEAAPEMCKALDGTIAMIAKAEPVFYEGHRHFYFRLVQLVAQARSQEVEA